MDYKRLLKYCFYIEVINFVFTIFKLNKTINEQIPLLIVSLIALIFSFKLYLLSCSNNFILDENRKLIIIISIYLLLASFLSGFFAVLYLVKTKKNKVIDNKLPIIKNNYSKLEKIFSLFFILLFLIVYLIFPRIKVLNKIPNIFIYVVFFILNILINYKTLKKHFIVFIKNKNKYIPFIIKSYLKMYFVFLIVSFLLSFITKNNISKNQTLLNEQMQKMPVLIFMLTTIYAPIVEEGIFRLSFSKLINRKWPFIIISALLFGILHVINNITSFYDIFFIIQYVTLGFFLSKAYYDSKNIFVSVSMHFIQNFIASLLIIILNIYT